MPKLDRRRKYYLILDTETATLPLVKDYPDSVRKKIAIAKPLIYDLGWQIIDCQGRVYKKASYLITEIFSVPQVFDTAYYANKKPQYLDKLSKGEIQLVSWATATAELFEDLQAVDSVGAYNSMFDFKKAIPFTELYINNLYSPKYYDWENIQRMSCNAIANGKKTSPNPHFDGEHFNFRGQDFNLFDVWGLACEELLNNDDYRKFCYDNNYKTASGRFFSTTAEICYRYLMNENDFIESHTALEDSIIESQIMALIMKKYKHKFKRGLTFFPFKIIGEIEEYEMNNGLGIWGELPLP